MPPRKTPKPSQIRRIEAVFRPQRIRCADARRDADELIARHGDLAWWLCRHCPDSIELNTALKYLQNSMFWGHCAISRNQPPEEPASDGRDASLDVLSE